MSILRRLLHGTQLIGPLKRLRGRIPFFHAETSDKLSSELRFKSWVVSQQIAWFRGELPMLYGEPAPAENVRVNVGTEKDNAILTWAKVHQERKYLEDLLLDEDAFAGMKLLDIGSSAVPSALCFKDCDVFCLEPLLPELLKIGYPFWYYDKRARFIYGFAEEMPFPDSFFDAIIAVNSLDHVDDFYRCSAEIRRVSKPDVKLRFHLHYHKATSTEPLELSDAIVAQAFSWCAGFHKVGAAKTKRGTQLDLASDEIFTVWSNF